MRKYRALLPGFVALAVFLTACGDEPGTSFVPDATVAPATTANTGGNPAPVSTPAPSPTTAAPIAVTLTDEARERLSVREPVPCDSVDRSTLSDGSSFMVPWVGALERPTPEGLRLWTDAMSAPLLNQENAQAAFFEVQQTGCVDPLHGKATANMFHGMEVGGVKLVDLNPWLVTVCEASEDTSLINDQASALLAGYAAAHTVGNDASDEQLLGQAKGMQRWEECANLLNALLERAKIVGVFPELSVKHWHLAGGGAMVGEILPEVEVTTDPEDKPALVLMFDQKAGDECLMAFGFNVLDRRQEVFVRCEPDMPPPGTNPPTTATTPPTTVPETVPPTHPPASGPPPVATQPRRDPPATTATTVFMPPPGPTPQEGQMPPPPNDGGYDSGEEDGSGTPNGGSCQLDANGDCIDGTVEGGGPDPDTDENDPVVDTGTHSGMPAPPP